MDQIEKQKQELQELIDQLELIRGRHTELVSVLIPAGYNINVVTRQLESERSTADNIKSKQTRSNVTDALDRIIRELKLTKQTPPHGLALYCGNVSENEGNTDLQFWAVEPPKPLKIRSYRCDQVFLLDPLKEMLEVDEVYGLLVIDRQAAAIGLLEGNQIKVLQKLTSGVPGKIRAGGQCLSPDTLIETTEGKKPIKDIQIGEEIKALNIENKEIIFTKCLNKWKTNKPSILIKTDGDELTCSPNHTLFISKDNELIETSAENLSKDTHLLNTSQQLILISNIEKGGDVEMIDIETEAKNFFANNILVHNSSQRFHRITEGLAKDFFRRVAETMKDHFFELKKLKGILIGGPIPTKEEFLEEGQLVTKLKEKVIAIKDLGYVDEHGLTLLVEASQEDIQQQELIKEKKIIENFMNTLGKNPSKAIYGLPKIRTALERGAVEKLLIAKHLPKEEIAPLEKTAENIGAEVIFISKDHPDGDQFYNLTKGVGALLRFAIE